MDTQIRDPTPDPQPSPLTLGARSVPSTRTPTAQIPRSSKSQVSSSPNSESSTLSTLNPSPLVAISWSDLLSLPQCSLSKFLPQTNTDTILLPVGTGLLQLLQSTISCFWIHARSAWEPFKVPWQYVVPEFQS